MYIYIYYTVCVYKWHRKIYGLVHPRKKKKKKNSPCMVVNVVHHRSPPFHQHLDKLHGRNLRKEIAKTQHIWHLEKKHFVKVWCTFSWEFSENSGARYILFSSNLPPFQPHRKNDPRLVHPKLPPPRDRRQIEDYIYISIGLIRDPYNGFL